MSVEIDPSSYVDPNGFVFWSNGSLYRAINNEVADFYAGIIESGYLDDLIDQRGVVGTRISDFSSPEIDSRLILEHDIITPPTYCVEWSPSMLRDAALLTLDLSIELAARDLMLQDAYAYNVMFDGHRPVFVDLTSIVAADDRWIWPAYSQFQAFFSYPLQLASVGRSRAARLLLLDNIGGITIEKFFESSPSRYSLTHPGDALSYLLNQRLQKNPRLRARVKQLNKNLSANYNSPARVRFLKGLKRKISKLKFHSAGDVWKNYYDSIPDQVEKKLKLNAVTEWIEKLSPSSVLDLGANTGIFSLVAAKHGARVVAIDESEACMESLYASACAQDIAITPVVSNVLCPTPSYGFMSRQYKPLFERVKSDLVLCLGLMHHLHIAGRQSFPRIAELLASVTSKHLIFEFVSMDDANNELIEGPRKIDYQLDQVKNALSKYFTIDSAIPSDRDTREILICSLS